MDHPMIERVNQYGYFGTSAQDTIIETCKCYNTLLRRGDIVVEFYDHLFCDEDCLTDAFSDNPKIFGMEKRELS